MCGNEIDNSVCPICGESNQNQYYAQKSGKSGKYKTVNIKSGMPQVQEAKQRVLQELQRAKMNGVKVIKFIHGYGSSGIGGNIRVAVRRQLYSIKKGLVINGENFTINNPDTQKMLKQYPRIRNYNELNSCNGGMTLFFQS